jgi:tRNA(Ile)-lysidine synthase
VYTTSVKSNIILYKFFEKHLLSGKHYLIAVSGGVDSMYLLHQIHGMQERLRSRFTVVSIDHGLRPESKGEVEFVRKNAELLGFPCVWDQLTLSSGGELEARNARYQAIRKIYQELKASGLLLGHHLHDQHETIIKRFFEGSSLRCSGGMKESLPLYGMRIMRPLLSVSKDEITDAMKGVPYRDDPTNKDLSNLRSIMRKKIIPQLEEAFGKNIRSNLSHWADQMDRLKDYIDSRVSQILQSIDWKNSQIELNDNFHPFEWDYILRGVLGKLEWKCSRDQITTLIGLIGKRKTGKRVLFEGGEVIIHDKGILIVKK